MISLLPDRVLCWCTAEYVSSELCGIGIATDAEYRRQAICHRNYGTLCRGMSATWEAAVLECAAGYLASARIAEKVGFELLEHMRFRVGAFAE